MPAMRSQLNEHWRIIVLSIVIALLPSPLLAVTAPPDPSASCASTEYQGSVSQQQQTPKEADKSSDLVVVSGRKPLNTVQEIRMGQTATVCIMGLYNWIYVHKNKPTNLRLIVGGQILTKIPVALLGPPKQEYVNFLLQMEPGDAEDWKAWAAVVNESGHGDGTYNLPISVALADSKEVIESNAFVRVAPYPEHWYYLACLFVLLLAFLVYLGMKSDLLRYAIGTRPTPPLQPPYSLGLVQMAFWFYIVISAYVYICITTHQVQIPMGSVLILLGISSTTGLAAIFVDQKKNATAVDERNTLRAESVALTDRLNDYNQNVPVAGSLAEKDVIDKKFQGAQVKAQLAQLPPQPTSPTTKGFLTDLLNDGDGISFHRFQIAAWTVVLGSAFVWSVYRNIAMPTFDPSLLALMGISSGTYVGFKFPEKLKT